MSPDIRELDDDTRDRIAAGEVVERPASVVKELLENALDAGASRVTVGVESGGKERIVVTDDGVGMSEAEVRKAVREHTTSKLRDISDLDSIGTLGFRGEALHAIGSVARLCIRTKPRGGSRGTELVVSGGDVQECGPVGCPEGTTVEVTDLFGNVPARRKYLKTDATEFDHVQSVVAGYGLANPAVSVTLEHDGRESFSTAGDGDRRSAVMAVYGREVAASMVPIAADHDDGGPLAGVDGLISHPETNRAGREYMTTLVNGRYVTASTVREAVVDAYGTQLAPDRYPFAVVDIDVPPGGVDVNVHPRKLEVLFADSEGVRRQVREAVEAALLDEGLLRSSAPRGRSAPEQTEIPAGDDGDGGRDADAELTDSGHHTRPEAGGGSTPTSASRGSDVDDDNDSRPTPAWTGPDSTDSETSTADSANDGSTADTVDRRFRDRPTQRTFDGEETRGAPETFDRLPSLSVLGQFDDTYLVCESADGLLLIDQHAADERVNYERLRERFAGDVTTQTLADPVELAVTAREAALLDDHSEALARLGFRVRRADDRTVTVTTVPALLAEELGAEAAELARDLLGEFVEGDPTGTVEAVVDDLLGDLACHPSIKGNTSLREGTVAELLAALDDCENPYACPHGRPTIIELPREEIENRFERDYPGHGGRRD
ncbi:DNA mismatch repair endonuclease MutL [Natronomonas gomsonensis]|uniref:DNA mismatch repair endonuclease MutL n=1 Tax=Natronomonas gomsonensis TaxID=1046043 RepID=UPI0020CA5CF7|nr:DNA mismatch repair endonuclease MutL [Natronomonas gomsonensis]MCY4730889.1 DNA mismatch repair endonuclease MutL [Natronomonas gomsonensis]